MQYCARPGAPPPARTVALVAPPPLRQGACEVSIFSEPGFGGTNATSADEQPHLSELGWRDQVASIKVAAGTWDFFTGEDFTGEVARFGPGEYPTSARSGAARPARSCACSPSARWTTSYRDGWARPGHHFTRAPLAQAFSNWFAPISPSSCPRIAV